MAVDQVKQGAKAIPGRNKLAELGHHRKWDNWCKEGFPMKGSTEIFSKKKATELYGKEVYLNKVRKSSVGCPSCFFPCKSILEVREGEFKGLVTFAGGGGFPSKAASYGIRCGVGSYDRVLKIHDMADRFGIDTHSFGSLLDFAVELFEKERITLEDTGGIELKRDFETTYKLMKMTAFRQGFGDIMADGYKGFFRRFGEDLMSDAVQAKGITMVFDPRLNRLGTWTFIQVVNPRGGDQEPGLATPSVSFGKTIEDYRKYCERTGVPPDAQQRIFSGPMKVNIARLTKHSQEFITILNSLGICSLVPVGTLYSLEDCAEIYSSLKGMELSSTEMKKAGERVWNLYKMVNVREGFNRKDDQFPEKWFTPIRGEEGERPLMDYFESKQLTREDLQNLLNDYYDECGWDEVDGIPTREKLDELGLSEIL
jgi:aldehyde:ferredoxin oxidoreductase